MDWRGIPFNYDALPPWTTYVWKCFLSLILEDTWHYWVHRLLHWKPFYPHVHKIHHTYTAPFGIVAEYAHWVETLVLGFGFFIPMLLLCDHMLFMFLWFLVRQVQTHEAHIGYTFPYNPLYVIPFYGGARAHDLHHKLFECNYASTFTYWDRICGTYVAPHAPTGLRIKDDKSPTNGDNANGNGTVNGTGNGHTATKQNGKQNGTRSSHRQHIEPAIADD
jgi:methylsterol monooxygenase